MKSNIMQEDEQKYQFTRRGKKNNYRVRFSEQKKEEQQDVKQEDVKQEDEQPKLSPQEAGKLYPLTSSWTLWYGKWDSPSIVSEISDIGLFWAIFDNIRAPSRIVQKLEYHMFLTGVRPNAEEDINKNGGSWVLECNKWDVDKLWLHTVLSCIGSQFTHYENIMGLVVTCRTQFARIQMWCNVSDIPTITEIGNEWRRLIGAENYPIRFHRHHEFYKLQDVNPLLSWK